MPGYKGVVPVEPLGPELQCSQCSFLLREALQTEEGDRMCRSCFEEKKQKGVWWSFNLSCSPDDAVDEKIQLLRVYCTNSAQGCSWEGKLKDLKEHCDSCPKSKCPNGCGEVSSSVINYYDKKTSPYGMVSYKHCSKTIPANELQAHQVACYELQKLNTLLPRGAGSLGSLLFKERPALKSGIYPLCDYPSDVVGLSGQLLCACATLASLALNFVLGPQLAFPHYGDSCYPMEQVQRRKFKPPDSVLPNSLENTIQCGKKFKEELQHVDCSAITTQPRTEMPKSYSWFSTQQSQASVTSPLTPGDLSGNPWVQEMRRVRKRMKILEKRVRQLEKENKSKIMEPQTSGVVTGQGGIGEPCVTKLVYQRCISEICEWIDVEAMVPQLMQYSIITTQDDIHVITHGLPSQRRNYLYSKLCGSKNGFQLFYRCLRESQSNQLGHKDAADKLEEIARKFGPGYAHQCSP